MTAILEVKDLAYTKGDGHPIISEVTFTVEEGDVVVLRGVSGAGYVRNIFNSTTARHNDFVKRQEVYIAEVHCAPRSLLWPGPIQGTTSSTLR